MSILVMEECDRPREKLASRGARALGTHELVAILLGSGNRGHSVLDLARAIERILRSRGGEIAFEDLQNISGIGPARSAQILAAVELGRRVHGIRGTSIRSSTDVLALLEEYRHHRQEHFLSFSLDGAGCLIARRVISIGTLNASLVHPREVFGHALEDRAASLIVAHNHPSGTLEPSRDDIAVTHRLQRAGSLLGIDLLDHLIVTPAGSLSLREHSCWLRDPSEKHR